MMTLILTTEEVIRNMDMMLNLVNKIPDDEAEYLYQKVEDTAGNDKETVAIEPTTEHRRLVLFVSHSRDLITFGFINDNLVWFSFTKTDDLLLTRRIFDCMKVGKFYRKVTPDKALMLTGVAQLDLYGMCRADITHLECDYPTFTGCLTNSSENSVTGVEFANLIAVLPQRIKANINNIGTIDDILIELEKDYQILETLRDSNDTVQKKRSKALAIRNKWCNAICLNMSDRATVRSLYRDICCHSCAVDLPAIADMFAIT